MVIILSSNKGDSGRLYSGRDYYNIKVTTTKDCLALLAYAHLININLWTAFRYPSDYNIDESVSAWACPPPRSSWQIDKEFLDEVIKHNIVTIKDETINKISI